MRSARLEMTALGVYIGFFNGERLTEEELLPGFTDYRHRVQVQSYDVTDRIQTGENVMAAVIGDGWYRGGLGAASVRNQFGKRLAWMCRLSVVYQDGTEDVFEADSDTRATQNGPSTKESRSSAMKASRLLSSPRRTAKQCWISART